MTGVILQPSYLPWRGYFHQIYKADVFVFYDDVQYDHNGWRNRNRIKTAAGLKWLTIPVRSRGAGWKEVSIAEMRIAEQVNWRRAHPETIRHSYARAPYFYQYCTMVEKWFENAGDNLADFTMRTTIDLARALGIEGTRFVRSSAIGCAGSKTERLVRLLQCIGADHYVSGPSAQEYLQMDLMEDAGITVEWMKYEYPEYPQLHGRYEERVSVLDLLMQTGPEAGRYIWGEYHNSNKSRE